MRFDEINIIGEFKINGLTGSPGQALGLSGSEFTWITVSASSIIDAVGLTGTDYVICQSVNTGDSGSDAIENGNRLKSAYASASALYVSNRVSVLITPGDYDFGATPLQLTTTKVDLIGLSSDASDVILRGSGDYVLQLDANIDTALYNVTLGTSSLFSVYNDGNTGDYLRWNNVIAIGNIFSDDNTSYESLNGEFKNIKVYNSPFAFYTLNGDIDGTYDNIEVIDVDYGFFSNGGFLLGTYSNIILSGTLGIFFQTGADPINASFENIKSGNINNIFSSYQISGTFRNIEIGDVDFAFSSNGGMDGIFEDIKIGNSSTYCFYSSNGNLTGTFSNIEITSVNDSFYCQTFGTVSGTYQNIEIGIVNNNLFYTDSGSIQGTYKNIKTEDIGGSAFITYFGDINGVFENIEIGNVVGNLFFTDDGSIQGTYKNIKTEDIGDTAFRSRNTGDIDGIFTDIEVGNVGIFIEANILTGSFNNIKIRDGISLTSRSFQGLNQIDVVLDLLEVGNGFNTFVSSGTVSGTYSNIEIGNATTNTFYSGGSLIGTYENIKIGTCSNAFVSTTSDINGYFDTIEIGDVSNSSFVPSYNLLGTYKNIKMNSGSSADLFSSAITGGVFDNIKVINSNTINNFFNSLDTLYGTFSNIEANGQITNAFSSDTGVFGDYKNLTLGTVSILFNSVSLIGVSAVIDNLKTNSYLNNFSGKITNSTIDSRGLSSSAISITDTLGTPIIERCKFLSDSGYYSISSTGEISALISFTITNYGITSSITNNILPADPLNIDNSNIT